jgi:hypothetical protein
MPAHTFLQAAAEYQVLAKRARQDGDAHRYAAAIERQVLALLRHTERSLPGLPEPKGGAR